MIAYIDSNNSIVGMVYGTQISDLNSITHIPSSCIRAVLVDESNFVDSTTKNLLPNNIYKVSNVVSTGVNGYKINIGTADLVATAIPAATLLANAKQAKTLEITQAYASAVNSTFTSSATGTALVYNFSNVGVEGTPSPQDTWNDLFKAIDKNLLPSTAFPMPITLANGTVVNHTEVQLQQIEADIAAWKFPLYQKYQKLVTGDIPNAATVDVVNAITW